MVDLELMTATGYAGVIDLDTPAFSDAAADLENIYSAIAERGLALAQGNPKDTVTGAFAASHKAPFIQNDVWIDKSVSPQAVAEELEKLKQLALNGNIAVGFFHPYPAGPPVCCDQSENSSALSS